MLASSRVWALVTWTAFVVASSWIVFRADYRADISAFLPKNPTPNQQLLVDQFKEGVVSRLTLIGIDGADAATLAQTAQRLTAQGASHWEAIEPGLEDVFISLMQGNEGDST